MDSLSSAASASSSHATAPTLLSPQPTYTTAGTLYNPSSSQPLQPPNRRGRSLKWTTGGNQPDLTLLPKAFLKALPLGVNGGRSPEVPYYNPLQQNSDRAIGPMRDQDILDQKMSAQVPRMRSGNRPASPSPLFSDADNQEYAEEASDEDDSDSSTDLLINMTVKSLHNLASYPNPNQKRAQKALSRGTKSIINGISSTSRSSASSTPLNRPQGHLDTVRERAPSPYTLKTAQSDPLAVQRLQDGASQPSGRENENAQTNEAKVNGHAVGPVSKSVTLASGPGAPQPLTAGPPGQRQYRPSTFESTFKALQTQQQQRTLNDDDENQAFAVTRRTLLNVGIEDVNIMDSSAASHLESDDAGGSQHSAALPGQMSSAMVENAPRITSSNRLYGAPSTQVGNQSLQDQPVSIWSYQPASPHSTGWSGEYFGFGSPQCARISPMTSEEIQARNEKLDQAWYAGSELLSKPARAVMVDGVHEPYQFGAIGEGRIRKKEEKK